MSYQKVEIYYQFTLQSYLKIGAGFGKNSYIDNTFRKRKNAQNQFVYEIPGTSVKGRIRAKFEQLIPLFPADYTSMIFGKEGQEGWAHFSSLTATKQVHISIATSTEIDRFRKAASQQSLRVEEYIQLEEGSAFEGTIEGFMPKVDTSNQVLFCLLASLLQTTYFGGDKSTGFGKGQIEILAVIVDDTALALENIREKIIETLI